MLKGQVDSAVTGFDLSNINNQKREERGQEMGETEKKAKKRIFILNILFYPFV